MTLVASRLLPASEPEAGATIEQVFEAEGIQLLRGRAKAVKSSGGGGHVLECALGDGSVVEVEGDTLLLATGRKPVVSSLGLDDVGVELDGFTGGIAVDAKLRTSVKGVYAAGDCTGDAQFTHYAGFQGAIAARNILLPLADPGVVDDMLPRVTFTAPEVASIGLSEAEAAKQLGADAVRAVTQPLASVDRAICDGQTEGVLKLVVKRKDGTILGATFVAPPAGELISEIAVAMTAGVKLPALASVIHGYPSYSIALQTMAAGVYYEELQKKQGLYDLLKKLGL